jgi:hypothetical protein
MYRRLNALAGEAMMKRNFLLVFSQLVTSNDNAPAGIRHADENNPSGSVDKPGDAIPCFWG